MPEPSAPSAALVVGAGALEQQLQRHAGEFAAAQHAVGVLAGRHGDVAPLHAAVGATFDEVEAAHRRQPHQLVHRPDHRRPDELRVVAVDHQPVLARVDVPPALVVALEVHPRGGDDAEQALQRREADARLRGLRQARALAALHVGFVLRRLAVAGGRDRLAEAGAVRGQLQDRRVTVGGGRRRRTGGCAAGERTGPRAPEEVAPAGLGLFEHPLYAAFGDEVFRRLVQPAGVWVAVHRNIRLDEY
jgi:hypothetical protein